MIKSKLGKIESHLCNIKWLMILVLIITLLNLFMDLTSDNSSQPNECVAYKVISVKELR